MRPCEERQGDSKGTGCSGRREVNWRRARVSDGPWKSKDWGRGLPRWRTGYPPVNARPQGARTEG